MQGKNNNNSSSYHQKALQQIRNSLQPFATSESGSTSSGISSLSSSNNDFTRVPQSSSPSRHSPRGIEYRAQQYPFVPSQVPPSVQQLLRRIDSPSSPSSSSSNSPTSQLNLCNKRSPIVVKKPTLIIKSTVVPKPVLQTAVPYSLPPPLPPKPPKIKDSSQFSQGRAEMLSPPQQQQQQQQPLSPPPISISPNSLSSSQQPPQFPQPQIPPSQQQQGQSSLSSYAAQPPPLYTQQQHINNNNNNNNPPTPPSPLSFDISPSSHAHQSYSQHPPPPHVTQSVPPPPTSSSHPGHLNHNNNHVNHNNNNHNNLNNNNNINNNNNNNNHVQHPQQQQQPQPQQPNVQTKAFIIDNVSNENENGTERKTPPEVTTHESPIPERKKLSREKEEERFESKVRVYSPQAFKFFMEQHVENVIKSHQERVHRRLQLEAEMAKIGLSEEAQTQMRRMLSQKESNYIRLKRAKMDKSMFKCIRTIGVGAFGEVALVRKLDTQHLYAMKTLRKSDVLRRNQVAHVKAERDILAEADNEWVVKLYYSFQDIDHLYFVMDYIPGGDLMSLLIKKGIFEEPLAQFYIAELICAVESVHKMGFIHRDIKPDNILIDRDGHIKLTDFGLCTGFRWTHNSKYYQDSNGCHCEHNCQWQTCPGDKPILERRRKKEHIRCLAHSLVGTPNYIAPEVLMRTGYTQLCDWWSVGVILYEMLVGQPPFLAPTPAETQYKVINWVNTLRIPQAHVGPHLSSQAKDLILKLCTDHTRRLGKNGPEQVKSHAFFNSIDFESGLRRTVAPFVPKIRHPTDTSNFDPCDGDKPEDTDSSPFDSNQFHGFYEFTFRRFFDSFESPNFVNYDEKCLYV